jgi:hypothetical protein
MADKQHRYDPWRDLREARTRKPYWRDYYRLNKEKKNAAALERYYRLKGSAAITNE